MKEIKVTRYCADDGKEFNTREACVTYESEKLNYRRFIDFFEMFDDEFKRMDKPEYLWSYQKEQFEKELEQDKFDFAPICDNAIYFVFKRNISDYEYEIIKNCFKLLGEFFLSNFDFPDKLEGTSIICWIESKGEWENFSCELEKAREIFDTFDYLKNFA